VITLARIFYNQARMSGKAHPQIAVVMARAPQGGLCAAMSECRIIVKGARHNLFGGNRRCQAATGERSEPRGSGRCDVQRALSQAWRLSWPRMNGPCRGTGAAPLWPG